MKKRAFAIESVLITVKFIFYYLLIRSLKNGFDHQLKFILFHFIRNRKFKFLKKDEKNPNFSKIEKNIFFHEFNLLNFTWWLRRLTNLASFGVIIFF